MPRTPIWIAPLFLVLGCHGASTVDGMPPPAPEATARLEARAVGPVGNDPGHAGRGTALSPRAGHQLAAFAAGCFWGVEDAFRKIPGVTATAVGYSGGHTKDPTYEVVCEHASGHAETVLVEFDPAVIGYERLLAVFFRIHDPTTVDRQGPDVGDQYRSAIFTFSPAQDAAAHAAAARASASLHRPVATLISGAAPFYLAEEYHQQYAERTGHHGCPVPNLAEGT